MTVRITITGGSLDGTTIELPADVEDSLVDWIDRKLATGDVPSAAHAVRAIVTGGVMESRYGDGLAPIIGRTVETALPPSLANDAVKANALATALRQALDAYDDPDTARATLKAAGALTQARALNVAGLKPTIGARGG